VPPPIAQLALPVNKGGVSKLGWRALVDDGLFLGAWLTRRRFLLKLIAT